MQEAELEVWKQDRDGRFALLKTYPICRWSGDLGPKIREGDRQAPEGFYSISPAQMNPQSSYYLAFNTGYPNAFDKALGRKGAASHPPQQQPANIGGMAERGQQSVEERIAVEGCTHPACLMKTPRPANASSG